MSQKLYLSASPHIRVGNTTQKIMRDVIISLLPAAIAGTVIFGLRSLLVIAVCIISALLSEGLFNIIAGKKQTIGDLSSVVTGLLLALNLPANVPLWQAVAGTVFAIVIVKCAFGGLGCNFVNPAITARVFMLVSFGSMVQVSFPVDAVSGATPLADLGAGNMPYLSDLFLGTIGGCIGETCVPALVIGFIYLLARKVISWHLPVTYILTVFVLCLGITGWDIEASTAYILSGGLILGAVFMATDYVTSPATAKGKVIFGIGCGIITTLIRFYGNYPEGVSFAILLMNILNPYIEKWSKRKLFGGAK